jgi:hypothetical protein
LLGLQMQRMLTFHRLGRPLARRERYLRNSHLPAFLRDQAPTHSNVRSRL